MVRAIVAAAAGLLTLTSAALAANDHTCGNVNHRWAIKRVPNVSYFVHVDKYDDSVEVLINGQSTFRAIFNSTPQNDPLKFDLTPHLIPGRTNRVDIIGFNRAYGKDDHDPNPGHIRLSLDGQGHIFNCEHGDWRISTPVMLINYTFDFTE
jgi:hypothetical protein